MQNLQGSQCIPFFDKVVKQQTLSIWLASCVDFTSEIGEKIIFLEDGKKGWEGTNKEVFKTENKGVENFVYSSELFKKVRKVYLKS